MLQFESIEELIVHALLLGLLLQHLVAFTHVARPLLSRRSLCNLILSEELSRRTVWLDEDMSGICSALEGESVGRVRGVSFKKNEVRRAELGESVELRIKS